MSAYEPSQLGLIVHIYILVKNKYSKKDSMLYKGDPTCCLNLKLFINAVLIQTQDFSEMFLMIHLIGYK